jgi:hypothetical protein
VGSEGPLTPGWECSGLLEGITWQPQRPWCGLRDGSPSAPMVLFCFFVEVRFEVRASHLQSSALTKQVLYGLSHSTGPFCVEQLGSNPLLWLFWRWVLKNYLPWSGTRGGSHL